MVNGMDTILYLVQILLDAGLILQCCQAVFKEREEREGKDFLLFPIITVFFYGGESGDDGWKQSVRTSVCRRGV